MIKDDKSWTLFSVVQGLSNWKRWGEQLQATHGGQIWQMEMFFKYNIWSWQAYGSFFVAKIVFFRFDSWSLASGTKACPAQNIPLLTKLVLKLLVKAAELEHSTSSTLTSRSRWWRRATGQAAGWGATSSPFPKPSARAPPRWSARWRGCSGTSRLVCRNASGASWSATSSWQTKQSTCWKLGKNAPAIATKGWTENVKLLF